MEISIVELFNNRGLIDIEEMKRFTKNSEKLSSKLVRNCAEICKDISILNIEEQEEELKSLVHCLISAAGYVGAKELQQTAQQIERMYNGNDCPTFILGKLFNLADEYSSLLLEYDSCLIGKNNSFKNC